MGDFSAHFQRPDAGIHTVEGTVAGNRATQLAQQREQAQASFQERKHAIIIAEQEQQHAALLLGDKFAGGTTSQKETAFSKQTVGLVTADEFKQLQQQIIVGTGNDNNDDDDDDDDGDFDGGPAKKKKELTDQEKKALKKARKKKRKQQQKAKATLSFASAEEEDLFFPPDDDNNADDINTDDAPAKKSKKDPTVDTSFLPDQQRDQQAAAERQQLLAKWKQQQAATKQESLEITYSYWDGSGHRRTVVVQKGDSIGVFLEKVRQELCREFRELTSTSADALLYIKEDLILPQDLTFYDLIVTKARGKSGPLFHFDVHDDVRVGPMDVRIEKDESHPGKVVERRWYERNKHIFPASESIVLVAVFVVAIAVLCTLLFYFSFVWCCAT